MGVAIGGRVDDYLEALSPDGCMARGFVRAAINRADICGGLAWRAAARDLVKFAFVMPREEHVVMGEIKACGLGVRIPNEGRKRALRWR